MTNPDELLKASEVAKLLAVTPKTVGRWAREGKVPVVRTLGGHMRFRRADVDALLAPR